MLTYNSFIAKKTLTPFNAALLDTFSTSILVCDNKTPTQIVRDELFPLGNEGIYKASNVDNKGYDLKTGKVGKSDIRGWVIDKLKKEIEDYMTTMRSPTIPKDAPSKIPKPSAINIIIKEIIKLIPSVVAKVLGEMIPLLGDAVDLFQKVKASVKKAFLFIRTNSLKNLGAFPVAGDVIDVLRDKVGEASIKNAAVSLCAAASLTATILTSGASSLFTSFANAVVKIFLFLKSIIHRELTRLRFRSFVFECKRYKTLRLSNKHFESWFKQSMIDTPVIAAYIVNMPLFNSSYNFLSLIEPPKKPVIKAMKIPFFSKKTTLTRSIKSGKSNSSNLSAYLALQLEAKKYITDGFQIESRDVTHLKYFNSARNKINTIINETNFIDDILEEIDEKNWLDNVLDNI